MEGFFLLREAERRQAEIRREVAQARLIASIKRDKKLPSVLRSLLLLFV